MDNEAKFVKTPWFLTSLTRFFDDLSKKSERQGAFGISHAKFVAVSANQTVSWTWYADTGVGYGAFHSYGGTPIAEWFIRENPILKWMMTGGTPKLQETSTCGSSSWLVHPAMQYPRSHVQLLFDT